MKLGRLNHIGVATPFSDVVIARSVATRQSRAVRRNTGLLRFARNGEVCLNCMQTVYLIFICNAAAYFIWNL